MELTFQQRLNARKAAEKVLGTSSKKQKADIVPVSADVLPVSELVDSITKIEGLKNILAAYTDKEGEVFVCWSTMSKEQLCYMGRQLNIFIDDHLKDD